MWTYKRPWLLQGLWLTRALGMKTNARLEWNKLNWALWTKRSLFMGNSFSLGHTGPIFLKYLVKTLLFHHYMFGHTWPIIVRVPTWIKHWYLFRLLLQTVHLYSLITKVKSDDWQLNDFRTTPQLIIAVVNITHPPTPTHILAITCNNIVLFFSSSGKNKNRLT